MEIIVSNNLVVLLGIIGSFLLVKLASTLILFCIAKVAIPVLNQKLNFYQASQSVRQDVLDKQDWKLLKIILLVGLLSPLIATLLASAGLVALRTQPTAQQVAQVKNK